LDSEIESLLESCQRLVQEQRYAEAIRGYLRVVELDPVHIRAYNNLGILHFQLGDAARAEEFFQKALELYFIHGIHYDERYALIKENLRKLRSMRQERSGSEARAALLREASAVLLPDERIVECAAGVVTLPLEDRTVESSAIVAATTHQVIVLAHGPLAAAHPRRLQRLAYGDIERVRVLSGIQRGTLALTADGVEHRVTSSQRSDLQAVATIIQEHIRRHPAPLQREQLQAQGEIAARMLKALQEMDIFTPEEIQEKMERFRLEDENRLDF